ncbi:MAG: hypothetical protein QGD96_09000 [Anaerolineae bacterium]|nr:hypothetical protein [Anaerolineae bacterium]
MLIFAFASVLTFNLLRTTVFAIATPTVTASPVLTATHISTPDYPAPRRQARKQVRLPRQA